MMSSLRYLNRLRDVTTDRPLRQSTSIGHGQNKCPLAPIWFPGKGAKNKNPAHPGNFYSTKLRAKLAWWLHPSNNCPTRLLQLLQHGVKVNFIDKSTFQPPPRPPRFIDPSDTLFAIQALQEGRKIGAYTDLATGGQQYLSRSRVSTPLHGKKRLVHALCPLNNATVKQPSRYETLKSLPNILKPNDFMVFWTSRVPSFMWQSRIHTANFSAATSLSKRS
jgi:hypothetical protein